MPRLTHEITIARSAKEVFATLLDFPNAPRWLPGAIETVQLTPGPIAVGAQFRERRKVSGRERTGIFTITELDPEGRVWLSVSDGATAMGTGGFVVVPVATGARVEYTLDFEIKGIARLLGFYVKRVVDREMIGDLEALKRYLEAPQPPVPTP